MIKSIYNKLFNQYGNLNWWPASSPYEVIVGAVLTQNTAWSNVEKAIKNFGEKNLCYDIVFLDPPYRESLIPYTLSQIVDTGIVTDGGTIVVETDLKKIDNTPCSLYLYDARVYGLAHFFFFKIGV